MNISDITDEYLDISTKYMRCLHIVEYLDIDPEYPFFSVIEYEIDNTEICTFRARHPIVYTFL